MRWFVLGKRKWMYSPRSTEREMLSFFLFFKCMSMCMVSLKTILSDSFILTSASLLSAWFFPCFPNSKFQEKISSCWDSFFHTTREWNVASLEAIGWCSRPIRCGHERWDAGPSMAAPSNWSYGRTLPFWKGFELAGTMRTTGQNYCEHPPIFPYMKSW